ncbi:MAG: metal ABC transporter permease [Pseudomonadota bacterium]
MLDDFFTRALIAGAGAAILAGPLGCFIVWRRLAYFGDTLAHAALMGVAIGLLLEINFTLAVFIVSAVVALALVYLQKRAGLSSDALLGLLSHSALALGLVVLAFITWVRTDILGLLFGDLLASSRADIFIIYGSGVIVLVTLAVIWRSLFAASVNLELARAEGLQPDRANWIFMLLLALVIALCMKIVGVLLITALLIIPAATARQFARGPEQMAVLSSGIGVLSVVAGLFGSLRWDTPSGPSIVVASFIFFVLSISPLLSPLKRAVRGAALPEKGKT